MLSKLVMSLKAVKDKDTGDLDTLILCNLTAGAYVGGSVVQEKFDGGLSLGGTLLLSHIYLVIGKGFKTLGGLRRGQHYY
ncbi:hypothetical protein PHLGIDRAFT_118392 [Phlebiopsis gigantea 11061_1 CR5-6]|uniref:Uncharacterized protein n=1 Tax=Phlebiopsis gigantea (strain 11061_1 CR5-6) TaxID=745531 RepID=A0A0C3SAH7_PHLG1|nr:hypothetical protein PHLGIDRAFT_118392 [Phlebiopsis gigantea 11061_1 CR5-6]